MKKLLIAIALALALTLFAALPVGAAAPSYLTLDTVEISSTPEGAVSNPVGRIASFNPTLPDSYCYPQGAMVASGANDLVGYVTLIPGGYSAKAITITHLDGLADDSFDLFVKNVKGQWVKVWGYTDPEPKEDHFDLGEDSVDLEPWKIDTFDISRDISGQTINLAKNNPIEVKILLTGELWKFYAEYGQLQICQVELLGREA